MGDTKTCSKCGLNLDLTEFSKRATGTLNARCKTCCRGAIRINKPCEVCGNTFPATNKSKKKFCSPECKKKHDLIQQAEKQSIQRDVRISAKSKQRIQNERSFPDVFEKYADLPNSRTEAMEQNSLKYFTGLLCKNGHLSPKWTKNSLCIACGEERNQESHARRLEDGRYQQQMQRANQKVKQRREEDDQYRDKLNEKAKSWQSKNRRTS